MLLPEGFFKLLTRVQGGVAPISENLPPPACRTVALVARLAVRLDAEDFCLRLAAPSYRAGPFLLMAEHRVHEQLQ